MYLGNQHVEALPTYNTLNYRSLVEPHPKQTGFTKADRADLFSTDFKDFRSADGTGTLERNLSLSGRHIDETDSHIPSKGGLSLSDWQYEMDMHEATENQNNRLPMEPMRSEVASQNTVWSTALHPDEHHAQTQNSLPALRWFSPTFADGLLEYSHEHGRQHYETDGKIVRLSATYDRRPKLVVHASELAKAAEFCSSTDAGSATQETALSQPEGWQAESSSLTPSKVESPRENQPSRPSSILTKSSFNSSTTPCAKDHPFTISAATSPAEGPGRRLLTWEEVCQNSQDSVAQYSNALFRDDLQEQRHVNMLSKGRGIKNSATSSRYEAVRPTGCCSDTVTTPTKLAPLNHSPRISLTPNLEADHELRLEALEARVSYLEMSVKSLKCKYGLVNAILSALAIADGRIEGISTSKN